jgi:hypothetical protein
MQVDKLRQTDYMQIDMGLMGEAQYILGFVDSH